MAPFLLKDGLFSPGYLFAFGGGWITFPWDFPKKIDITKTNFAKSMDAKKGAMQVFFFSFWRYIQGDCDLYGTAMTRTLCNTSTCVYGSLLEIQTWFQQCMGEKKRWTWRKSITTDANQGVLLIRHLHNHRKKPLKYQVNSLGKSSYRVNNKIQQENPFESLPLRISTMFNREGPKKSYHFSDLWKSQHSL